MAPAYGTLRPVEVKKRPSSKRTLALAALLATVTIAALSFTAGFSKSNSVIDTNFGRSQVTVIHNDVETLFKNACTNWKTERFVVAAFDGSQVLPAVKAGATDHWERDWKSFTNALTATDVAFSVYNFPVWDSANDFNVLPTFVSYLKEGVDLATKYKAGTYIGGAAIAAKCTRSNALRVTIGMTYLEACTALTGDASRCQVIDQTCPFDGGNNPCLTCGTTDFARSSIDQKCCEDVNQWCAVPAHSTGCSNYARAIYDDKCDEDFHSLERSQFLLLEAFEDEHDKCDETCSNSCGLFATPAQTYQSCSGCATDLLEYTYGDASFSANCYPGAFNFQESRCCGASVCSKFQDQAACETTLGNACSWEGHRSCGARLADEAAKAVADEAAAAANEEASRLAEGGVKAVTDKEAAVETPM